MNTIFDIVVSSNPRQRIDFNGKCNVCVILSNADKVHYQHITHLMWEFVDAEHTKVVLYLQDSDGDFHMIHPNTHISVSICRETK